RYLMMMLSIRGRPDSTLTLRCFIKPPGMAESVVLIACAVRDNEREFSDYVKGCKGISMKQAPLDGAC
ncbi:hypothetical protein, partial [Aeromonas bivalvium]|uniref:hypothetical protein n=1 Tax=Aeromonas bivalvium TaxID=440079 RepID=UPI001ADFC594